MLRKKCPSSGKLSHHQKSIVTSNYTSVYSSVVEGSKDWTKSRSAPTGDKKGAHLEHALLPLQPLLPLPHHPQELPARIWSRCHQILFDNRLILYYFLLLLICCFAVFLLSIWVLRWTSLRSPTAESPSQDQKSEMAKVESVILHYVENSKILWGLRSLRSLDM